MNIAPTHISAKAASGISGKRSILRALMVGVLLSGAAVSGVGAAAGMGDRDQRDQRDQRDGRDQRDQRERPQPQQQPVQPQQQPREMPQQRQYESRPYEVRQDDPRRQQIQQQQDGGRRGGRLTPDERRELRRQINEAGMDLYPNAPRR